MIGPSARRHTLDNHDKQPTTQCRCGTTSDSSVLGFSLTHPAATHFKGDGDSGPAQEP